MFKGIWQSEAHILMAVVAEISYLDEMFVAHISDVRVKDDGSLGLPLVVCRRI